MMQKTNITALFGADTNEPIVTACTLANRINFTFHQHKDDYIKELQLDYDLEEHLAETIITAAFTRAGANTNTFTPNIQTLNEWLEDIITDECADFQRSHLGHTTNHTSEKQSRDQLNEAIDSTIRILTKQGLSKTEAQLKLKQVFENASKTNAEGSYKALLKACVNDLNKVTRRPKVLEFKKLEA